MCDTKDRLDGKVAVVTGGSSGIGFEAAKNLANKGARVVIASRNENKLRHAKEQIIERTGNPNVDYKILDLGSLKSVRNFVNEVKLENGINILVNSAGAVALPDELTSDNLNLSMQVNFFGTFLLTFLLLPMLKASAPSRIMNGVGALMYIGDKNFDHWNDVGRYNLVTGLATSELAIALFNAELNKKLNDTGVTTNTYDPFVVKDTNILGNLPGVIKALSQLLINSIGRHKKEAGKEIAYLASASELKGLSGRHYKFCREGISHWLVKDSKLTRRLWEESKKLVKIGREEDWDLNTI